MDPQQSSTPVSCLRHWQPEGKETISIGMCRRSSPLPHEKPLKATFSDPTVLDDDRLSTIAAEDRIVQRGMTLVEILIVLALIGIAALVVVVNLQTIIRRFELESGVREFTAFVSDAPRHAKEISAPVFFLWDTTTRTFSITRDAAGTTVLDTLEIPVELTITPPASTVLRCDVYGRAFIGTGTAMMTTLETVTFSHAKATEASAPTYVLTLSPLWAVEVTR